MEAGGHVRGTLPTLELVARMRRRLPPDLAVLAAGGMADAADVRAALDAGAEGAVLGTRFLMTDESRAHPAYKQRCQEAAAGPAVADGRRALLPEAVRRQADDLLRLDADPLPQRDRALKNPFYAGAYVYGKSEKRVAVVDGRARKSYGHGKPLEDWEVLIKDHHDGYIDWAEFERNQALLAANAYGRVGGAKSGRGGRALLAGMLTCGRCGRGLAVAYAGTPPGRPVYRCDRPNLALGLPRCLGFGGSRVDAASRRRYCASSSPWRSRPRWRPSGCTGKARPNDGGSWSSISAGALRSLPGRTPLRGLRSRQPPDRRAAREELGERAAARGGLRARLAALDAPDPAAPVPDFTGLADDLAAAWTAPGVTTRTRQQLLRALVTDIIADVDEAAREVVLTIHWRGGQHSHLRVSKPRTGEHGCRTPEEALAVMARMAARWSDEDIAASLNRMGLRTGQGKTWTAHRVGSIRKVHGMHAYRSAEKNGAWLTMTEAAAKLGVTNHRHPPAHQGADPARRAGRARRALPDPGRRPRRRTDRRRAACAKAARIASVPQTRSQCFQILEEEGHYERATAVHLQHTGKAGQGTRHALALAIGRMDLDDRRRRIPAPGAVVTGVGPELPVLGPAPAGIEHRDGGLVGEPLGRALQLLEQPRLQRLEGEGRPASPVGQRRAI